MVIATGKIVCDCKENFAGKYCNIGKYNNLQADRIRSFHGCKAGGFGSILHLRTSFVTAEE